MMPLSPECEHPGGYKCGACAGLALDEATDEIVDCTHACHAPIPRDPDVHVPPCAHPVRDSDTGLCAVCGEVGFLLARIAEDEAAAQHRDIVTFGPERRRFASEWLRDPHDPARVLAECEAKRRIVESVSGWRHRVVEDCWYTCAAATEERDGDECCDDIRRGGECDCGRDTRVRAVLAPLAAVYADHPDYRPEWRP